MKNDLSSYFNSQKKAFDQLIRSVRKDPSQKDVHKLRISTRRIRNLLWIDQMDSEKIKKLGKILGKQRDLDVAIKNAKDFHLKNSKIKKKRSKRRKKTMNFLRERNFNVHFKKSQLNIMKSIYCLRKDLFQWKHDLDFNELHKFRICIKKVRYFLEAMKRDVAFLKDVQDNLGKVHDLQVLSDLYPKKKAIKRQMRDKGHKAMELAGSAVRFSIDSLTELEKTL